jgi:hypothetical protein
MVRFGEKTGATLSFYFIELLHPINHYYSKPKTLAKIQSSISLSNKRLEILTNFPF